MTYTSIGATTPSAEIWALRVFRAVVLFVGLAFVLVLMPATAFAGPWTREVGRVYAKVSAGLYLASSAAGNSGEVVEDVRYTGRSAAAYAEVGVLPRTHLSVYLPLLWATSTFADGTSRSSVSLSDVVVGLQVRPLNIRVPFALRVDAKIPAYSLPDDATDRRPLPGDGQLDLTGWASVGSSFPRLRLYALLEAGYRWRADRYNLGTKLEYHDSIVSLAQLGWFVSGRNVIALTSRATVPFGKSTITRGEVYLGLSGSIALPESLAIELGVDAPLWTRNGAAGWGTTVGLSWQR